MVWAAMKSTGEICLRRCPPRVDAAAYRGILNSAKGFIRGPGWRFQQDGAPAHRAASTTSWLYFKRVRRHNGGVWPPMSPDLNPIEHLWPFVLRALEGQVFSGRDQLWSALQEGFAEVPASFVKSLYDSLPRRMEAVIVARGGPTRY